jgi:rRNA processing protein Krr1/Pno1
MAEQEGGGMSKSARKRANKKAKEAEEVVEEPPAPEPKAAPKAKPKAKAAEPEPPKAAEAKPKAKADAKAKAKAEAKAEAKAKPKAAPKEAPKKEEPPPAPEPKPKAKADAKPKSKAAAKPKAKAKQEEEEPVKKVEELINYTIDDGSGGGWEMATGLTTKQQKQKNKKDEEKKYQEELKKAGTGKASAQLGTNVIPGMKPPEVVAAEMRAAAAAKSGGKAKSVAVVSAAAADDKGKEPEKPSIESFTATVKITDEKKIGWVVGPKGATIAMLKEKTGVKQIDTAGGNVVTIVGAKEDVLRAEEAIQQILEKGFCALQYDNYEEQGVMVHPQHFHQIIGVGGAVINDIKKHAKVEVSMPNVPKTAPNAPVTSKKYKVTLAGSKEAVAKGKEVIESIVLYGYHEITHPGFTHQEVECEEWKYKYLIGTKGSEMRHIQKNFTVNVNIPRAGSDCPNVVVTGEAVNVERAVKYIEKVMWNADQPKGRGSADQADDAWGDEQPEEDWMKAYLYKRK